MSKAFHCYVCCIDFHYASCASFQCPPPPDAQRRFNAVERMLQFQRVPQEKQREIPDRKPPPEWPMQGVVEFRDVWMRYREGLPPVLKARVHTSYVWAGMTHVWSFASSECAAIRRCPLCSRHLLLPSASGQDSTCCGCRQRLDVPLQGTGARFWARVKGFWPNHQICWGAAESGCRTQSAYAHSVWLLSIAVPSCRANALIPRAWAWKS